MSVNSWFSAFNLLCDKLYDLNVQYVIWNQSKRQSRWKLKYENAKQQGYSLALKGQVKLRRRSPYTSFHSLRRKHVELAAELSNLHNKEEKLLSETIPDLCWELAQLQDTYILQGDYDLKVMRQEYYIQRQKAV
ncbi:augmin subunit 3 isoform X1 [Tanacetum coccineum]